MKEAALNPCYKKERRRPYYFCERGKRGEEERPKGKPYLLEERGGRGALIP